MSGWQSITVPTDRISPQSSYSFLAACLISQRKLIFRKAVASHRRRQADDAGFRESKRVTLLECARVMVVISRLGICMWFGPVNKETYVHGCDNARLLCIRNNSGDREDPTGLELSPVDRGGFIRIGCVDASQFRERDSERERESPLFRGRVGPFYRIKRPTRTW